MCVNVCVYVAVAVVVVVGPKKSGELVSRWNFECTAAGPASTSGHTSINTTLTPGMPFHSKHVHNHYVLKTKIAYGFYGSPATQ